MQEDLQKIQARQLGAAVLLILAFMVVACAFLIVRSEQVLQGDMARLMGTDTEQIELNVSNYFTTLEGTAQLMFTDESYYAYDPVTSDLDAYGKIQAENAVRNRIIDIGGTENFSDFGVVYADDEHLGWISQTTLGLFSNGGMYREFAGCITDSARQSGWAFNVRGNTDRLWYVKRLNDDALLVMSVYANSLGEIFAVPEGLGDVTVSLVDGNNTVLFASNGTDVGAPLDASVAALVGTSGNVSSYNDEYFAASSTVDNGWRVVVAAPTASVMEQSTSMRNVLLLFLAFMVALFVLVSGLVYLRLARPVDTLVDDLADRAKSDQLTGLLNKVTYETIARQSLAREEAAGCFGYLILDIDRFKDVNDRFGHARGDEVLKRVGAILKECCVHASATGRVGGDEFSSFAFIEGAGEEETAAFARELIDRIAEEIHREFSGPEWEDLPITVSMGDAIAPAGSVTFQELYEAADAALYESKHRGRDRGTVTVYKEGLWC